MQTATNSSTTPARLTMLVGEFCDIVGISRSTFYAEVRAGRIQILKAGAKTMVASTEPARYLETMAAAASLRVPRRRGAAQAAA